MKCVIPGSNCKILARAIHALAKIGEEMYVQPREKSLSFRCVSMSNSAYCDFTFEDVYFSSYNFGNLDEEDALKCKISMRSALTVFKSPALIDRNVETCHIKLEPNADQLIFVFKFKNSVLKTFFLPIIDCEQLSVPYTKANAPNRLSAKSRVLADVVQNFQQNLIEITLEVTPQKLLMRNYVDKMSSVENSTRTQLAVTIGEFDEYTISQDSRITFCMKELRAILTFAEAVSLPVNIYFETTGRPVLFDVKSQTFEANLILSTLNPESENNSLTSDGTLKQTMRKRAASKKTPRQGSKNSSKRGTNNKSTLSSGSTSSASNITVLPNRTNLPEVSRRMDIDENDSSTVEMNSVRLNNAENDDAESLTHQRGNIRRLSESESCFTGRATTSGRSSPAISSLGAASSSRETGHSIFSPAWKKQKTEDKVCDDERTNSNQRMDEDVVPGSPPLPVKRAKMIFKKCYETTFDPRMLPGHDSVLAYDTDEDI